MTLVEGIGYATAGLGIAMIAMQTMIPLSITGLAHNIGQIAFGLIAGIYPTVIQHVVLLPLNAFRLVQMLKLIKQVKAASGGGLSMEWLKPFMTERPVSAGTTLFRKGEKAEHKTARSSKSPVAGSKSPPMEPGKHQKRNSLSGTRVEISGGGFSSTSPRYIPGIETL